MVIGTPPDPGAGASNGLFVVSGQAATMVAAAVGLAVKYRDQLARPTSEESADGSRI